MSLLTYTKVCIPEPYTIMGLRLRPFCLGHLLLMRRFDCGFGEDAERTADPRELIKDLLLALVICSMTYEDFVEAITSDKLVVNDKQVSFTKWLREWGSMVSNAAKSKDFNTFEKLALFRTYLKEGMQTPLFWEGEHAGESPESGTHWTQAMLLVLTGELGFTESQALNMPLSKALADYLRFAEKNGLVTLMTDEEIELVKANQQAPVTQGGN